MELKPHTTNAVLDILFDHFEKRLISNRFPERFDGGLRWAPFSPDLNPSDYFLWGYLEDRVYVNRPRTLEDLRNAIFREVYAITTDVMANVVENFALRSERVREVDGGHIEKTFVR